MVDKLSAQFHVPPTADQLRIRQYADITELDAVTLNKLVRQVVVHEGIGEDGARNISVEIHFNMRQSG